MFCSDDVCKKWRASEWDLKRARQTRSREHYSVSGLRRLLIRPFLIPSQITDSKTLGRLLVSGADAPAAPLGLDAAQQIGCELDGQTHSPNYLCKTSASPWTITYFLCNSISSDPTLWALIWVEMDNSVEINTFRREETDLLNYWMGCHPYHA